MLFHAGVGLMIGFSGAANAQVAESTAVMYQLPELGGWDYGRARDRVERKLRETDRRLLTVLDRRFLIVDGPADAAVTDGFPGATRIAETALTPDQLDIMQVEGGDSPPFVKGLSEVVLPHDS